jgi:pyruvate/2-oxoglutarate dehydrogenase complex dihydrolipoamide dehydrogenase (E3) component
LAKHFDAIIIGTGQAGPPLAERFVSAGMTVAMIERHKFGGTCVNTGCIPTKTLVASAYAAPMSLGAAPNTVSI